MSSRKMSQLQASWRIELTPELSAKIEELVEEFVRKYCDEHLEETVKRCLEEGPQLHVQDVLKLKKMPYEKATASIKKYIDEHQGCRTSDIMYDLGLEPSLVLDVLKELERKKKIRGK
jgi:hypothetical protein